MNIPRTFLFVIFCSFVTIFGMRIVTEEGRIVTSHKLEDQGDKASSEEGILIDLPASRNINNLELLEEIFPAENNSDLENSTSYRDLLGVSFDENEQKEIDQQIRIEKLKRIIEDEQKRKEEEDPFGIF